MDKRSVEYKLMRTANIVFLFCIVFEVVGIMTVMFWGTLGAEMAIYFMTFVFAVFIARKNGLSIVVKKPNISTFLQGIGITICGIPVALVLSALAAFMSSAGVDTSEDVTIYPIWLSLIAFAVVPAIVEEYVFRGVILGAYLQIEELAAVFISSLFFAMLHFSLGSVMYGFMYGCIFALVRVATGNLIYSVAMHGVFNMVNVAMAYIGITMVPGWIVLLAFSVGLAGFIILLIVFFKKNPVSLSKSSFKRRQLITREGYITLIICLCVTVMLLMM